MTNPTSLDWQVLNALLRAVGPVDIRKLAVAFKTDDQAIRQSLKRLQNSGCQFQQNAQGIQLTDAGLGTWGDFLKPITSQTQIYQSTSSTQDALRRIIEHQGKLANAAVVVADVQSAGRGRLGRQWVAPPDKCLLLSRAWIGHNQDPIQTINRLTFSTAVAMAKGIESVCDSNFTVGIKWPNDLLMDGKKLAGILVETISLPNGQLAAMIGMGININLDESDLDSMPLQMRNIPTSLKLCRQKVHRLQVLYAVLDELNNALAEPHTHNILDAWRQRSILMGQHVTLQHNARTYTGTVVDLDLLEGLILRTDHGALVHLPAASSTILP